MLQLRGGGDGGQSGGGRPEVAMAVDPQLLKEIRQRLESQTLDKAAVRPLCTLLERLPTQHFPALLKDLAEKSKEARYSLSICFGNGWGRQGVV